MESTLSLEAIYGDVRNQVSIEETLSTINGDINVYDNALNSISILSQDLPKVAGHGIEANILRIADVVGYNGELTSNLDNLSIEEIVSREKKLGGAIGNGLIKLGAKLQEEFKNLESVPALMSKYKTVRLAELKRLLVSSKLVRRSHLDTKAVKKFNKKMTTFYALGNSLENTVDDLVKYMQTPIDNVNNGYYSEYTEGVLSTLMAGATGNSLKKDPHSSEMFANSELKFKIKPSSSNFKFGFVADMWGDQLSITSIAKSEKVLDGKKASGFIKMAVHTDVVRLGSKYEKSIRALDEKEVLKILEFGLSKKSEIEEAMKLIRADLGSAVLESLLNITLVVVNLAGIRIGTATAVAIAAMLQIVPLMIAALGIGMGLAVSASIGYYANVGKYSSGLLSHLLVLNKNMLNFDSVIIDYIELTYEEKKEK